MLEACCYVYNVAITGAADGWPLQLRNHYILPNHHHRALQDVTADNRRFTERRKKTVRFDHEDGAWPGGWDEERQGSQDSQTKDSGIDTSSTFTSSEDSNRGDVPKVGQTITNCAKSRSKTTITYKTLYTINILIQYTYSDGVLDQPSTISVVS